MTNQELKAIAQTIAWAIRDTDTGLRGDLLQEVATILKDESQFYTGSLILKTAAEYGLSGRDAPETP